MGESLRYKGNRIPVLCYHRIGEGKGSDLREYSISPGAFKRQMRYLKKRGFNSLSIESLLQFVTTGGPLPENPIVITFDDGFKETLDNAVPILAGYGLQASFFIVSGKAGGENDWDKEYKDPLYPLASLNELGGVKEKNIKLESHSLSHKNLPILQGDELSKEISVSKEDMEMRLKKEVRFFAYPYAKFNEETKRVVREAGYLAAFSAKGGMVQPGDDLFELKRVQILRSDGFTGFLFKTKTGSSIKRYLKNMILRKR